MISYYFKLKENRFGSHGEKFSLEYSESMKRSVCCYV